MRRSRKPLSVVRRIEVRIPPLRLLACRTFGVRRSAYYRWKRRVERHSLEILRPREERERRYRCGVGRAGSSGVENTMMKRVVERFGLR